LRKIIDDSLQERNEIRQQASSLKVRLETCIEHLKKQLQTTELPVEELRSIINRLSGEDNNTAYQCMPSS